MSQLGKTNTLAVVSLVFGVLGWTALPLIGAIVAIVTGNMARREIRQSSGVEEGEGLATAGIVLGWVNLVLAGLFLALFILVIIGASIS